MYSHFTLVLHFVYLPHSLPPTPVSARAGGAPGRPAAPHGAVAEASLGETPGSGGPLPCPAGGGEEEVPSEGGGAQEGAEDQRRRVRERVRTWRGEPRG